MVVIPSERWAICNATRDLLCKRQRLERSTRPIGVKVLRAVAKQILFRQLLDVDNPGRDKNCGLAGTVWRRDFDQRLLHVSAGAFEAQAAAGNIFALDKFFAALGMTHQRDVIHLDARILAPVDARSAKSWRRHGLFRGRW
jgi:hypothetical protein